MTQILHIPKIIFKVSRTLSENKSWQERVCIRVFSTLMSRSNENKGCMRVDWILLAHLIISSMTPNPDRLSLSQFPVKILGVGDVIVPMRSTPWP
jgi:hypothetical protein